ncbi:MAG: helix-turn-helix domain-containing protein [Rhodomicrobium sp.]
MKKARKTAAVNRCRPQKGAGSGTPKADEHEKGIDDPEPANADLETEAAIAREMIEARTRAGLTQDELASRMETSRTVIARLERGQSLPSTRTLKRFAAATGSRLAISFVPVTAERSRKPKVNARAR